MGWAEWVIVIIFLVVAYFVIRRLFEKKRTRYVSPEVKAAVLKRYFGMCAACPEGSLLEFHHRKEYSDGGDNSERNVVPLCPFHHRLVTRYPPNGSLR